MTALEVRAPAELVRPDDPLLHLIEAWLTAQRSVHTRRAYRQDMLGHLGRTPCWVTFCDSHGLHPLTARRVHVDLWARGLEAAGLKPRTVGRKLSTLASFYKYCVWEEVIPDSPLEHVRRPKISDRGETPGLSHDELQTLLRGTRQAGSARSVALLTMLAFTGLRINEVLAADVEDVGHDRGHTTLRVIRKGGESAKIVLGAPIVAALEQYLDGRDTGPLFVTAGGHRMQQSEAWRMVRRLSAQAGLSSAGELSPHSLRVAFITGSREAGVPLEDVQDAVGHADPRTTRRYDRGRHSLDRHPAHRLIAWLADGSGELVEPVGE